MTVSAMPPNASRKLRTITSSQFIVTEIGGVQCPAHRTLHASCFTIPWVKEGAHGLSLPCASGGGSGA